MTTENETKILRALRELCVEQPLAVRVTGDCMSPLAHDGDVVRVSRVRFYWPGDVIAFRHSDGRLLMHRLIGYWPTEGGVGIITQADSSSSCEAAFGLDCVIGKVTGGDGSSVMSHVPIHRRFWAMGRFVRVVAGRVRFRLVKVFRR
jgi:hypothetical protein